MTLWGLIIPSFFLLLTTIAAHICHSSYWSAIRATFIASVAWLLPYFIGLFWVLLRGPTETFDLSVFFRMLVISVVGGLIAVVISIPIGLPFVSFRRFVAEERLKEEAQKCPNHRLQLTVKARDG